MRPVEIVKWKPKLMCVRSTTDDLKIYSTKPLVNNSSALTRRAINREERASVSSCFLLRRCIHVDFH